MVSLIDEDVGSDQGQGGGADRADRGKGLPDRSEHFHDPSQRPIPLVAHIGASRMKLVPFEMERWQSTWEHRVEFNLSESGVEPLPLRDLLREEAAIDRFLDHPLAYSRGNGTPELRSSIASLYPGATPDHVLVTNGSSEACLLALWRSEERRVG